MEFNATIDLIIKDLDDACRIIDDLKSYPGVPELQIELAKAKCKSAGAVIALLKNIKQQTVSTKTEKVEEPEVKEIAGVKSKPSESLLTIEQPAIAEEKKQPVKTIDKKEDSQKSPEREMATKKAEQPKPGSPIIADKFSNMSARINEQLASRKGDEDLTERIKSKHIHSLKEAIGVNDRFYFIREIFNGDKESYDQAIARLEEVNSESDVKAVISGYTGSDTESEAVNQLIDIVKRKLSPDE